MGNGVFSTDRPDYEESRQWWRGLLSKQRTRDLAAQRASTEAMMGCIQSGEPVEVLNAFPRHSLDSSTRSLLGHGLADLVESMIAIKDALLQVSMSRCL